MNDRIKEAYRKLLKDLYGKTYSEKDNNTTVFNAIKGKEEIDLMIVGRAPNGWGVYYNRNKPAGEERNTLEWVLNNMKEEDLEATIADWATKKKYSITRSQFWRVGRRIAKSVTGRNEREFDNVLYSNLYKVGSDGKNPTPKMIDATQENCIKILQLEIEIFQPKRILLLTGCDWAKPFIENLKIEGKYIDQPSDVSFIGKIDEKEFVVAVHPQGRNKSEDKITTEIRMAFNLPIPIK